MARQVILKHLQAAGVDRVSRVPLRPGQAALSVGGSAQGAQDSDSSATGVAHDPVVTVVHLEAVVQLWVVPRPQVHTQSIAACGPSAVDSLAGSCLRPDQRLNPRPRRFRKKL